MPAASGSSRSRSATPAATRAGAEEGKPATQALHDIPRPTIEQRTFLALAAGVLIAWLAALAWLAWYSL